MFDVLDRQLPSRGMAIASDKLFISFSSVAASTAILSSAVDQPGSLSIALKTNSTTHLAISQQRSVAALLLVLNLEWRILLAVHKRSVLDYKEVVSKEKDFRSQFTDVMADQLSE